jgi:hypothetical protein
MAAQPLLLRAPKARLMPPLRTGLAMAYVGPPSRRPAHERGDCQSGSGQHEPVANRVWFEQIMERESVRQQ